MSNTRLAIVKRAWTAVSGGADCVSFPDLCAKYNADAHPRVLSREKKAETVRGDFEEAIAAVATDGNVTEDGWCKYYSGLSIVLPAERENYFCEIVSCTWGLGAGSGSQVHSTRVAQLEDCLFEKVRQRTHGADDEGKTAKRIFKHFDLDGYGTISPNEFKKALETLGCTFTDAECAALFAK